jgi:hypothetical protein
MMREYTKEEIERILDLIDMMYVARMPWEKPLPVS